VYFVHAFASAAKPGAPKPGRGAETVGGAPSEEWELCYLGYTLLLRDGRSVQYYAKITLSCKYNVIPNVNLTS
jgi:hypothetical protein